MDLCFRILQAIKNLTVGRPGNDTRLGLGFGPRGALLFIFFLFSFYLASNWGGGRPSPDSNSPNVSILTDSGLKMELTRYLESTPPEFITSVMILSSRGEPERAAH